MYIPVCIIIFFLYLRFKYVKCYVLIINQRVEWDINNHETHTMYTFIRIYTYIVFYNTTSLIGIELLYLNIKIKFEKYKPTEAPLQIIIRPVKYAYAHA